MSIDEIQLKNINNNNNNILELYKENEILKISAGTIHKMLDYM